jgi:hypothetical protein
MNNQRWVIECLVKINSCRNTRSIKVTTLTRSFHILFLTLVSLCLSTIVLAQTQLGADIDGEAAYDASGYSVSLSANGERLAIGAVGNDGNGINSGHVRAYEWSGTAWVQLGTDIDGESHEDRFGTSVSLSSDGDRLAIGADGNDGSGINSGHVRVYQWSGTAWVQLGTDIDGESHEDRFGTSVSLSSDGDRLTIGAPNNAGGGWGSGHVRVYQWTDKNWVQLGGDIDSEAENDRSGHSVSISSDGNRLAIGAAQNDGNGLDSGHVRIYDLSMFNEFQINTGLSGAWYNEDQDGHGLNVIVLDENRTIIYWYVYHTDGTPMFLIIDGTNLGNSTTGVAYYSAGMRFGEFNPNDHELTAWGMSTVTFHDCNNLTLEYSLDDPAYGSGSIPMTKLANISGLECSNSQ